MSKNNEKSTILIKKEDKNYLAIEIVISSLDNSIYFMFPSKRERIVSMYNEKKFDNKDYSENVRELETFTKDSLEPKISFHPPNNLHPDSMIVHINSNKIGSIINNKEVFNIGKDGNVFIYLMQILMPQNIDFFDEYTKKHKSYIEIERDKRNNEILNLEFVIHSKNIDPLEYPLPYSKNRKIEKIYTLNSEKDLIYTVIVSLLDGTNDNPIMNSMIVSINTKEENCLYEIINK